MTGTRVPYSTYRLQLHKEFTFEDAGAVAPYLSALGVSHAYSSPYLQAVPGSMHGYDVVDHQRVNEELGGEAAHERFCKTLGENGLGQVLDIVPNHMAIGSNNRFWWDVLENGASSRYASFFDIDWNPHEERLRDKVLLPILADQYGRVLESGGIKILRTASQFRVEAAGQSLPVSPASVTVILQKASDYAHSDELGFVAHSLRRLPHPDVEDRDTVLARHRDTIIVNRLLERICREDQQACESIDRALRELNVDHDALDAFLEQQNYRLAFWKTADQQLSYRRFFDVNSLIGLHMERKHVFEETHALLLEWLQKGVLDGLRVDHPDGLRDPLEYFERLRASAPKAWIVGEKILASGEFLRGGRRSPWPIQGTTGYDFLNVTLGLLIKRKGMLALTEIYGKFTGLPTVFADVAHEKRIAVCQEALGSDVNRLTNIFIDICETHRNQRDYTRTEVRRAIREIAACFTIYRTYVVPPNRDRASEITAEDKRYISQAIQQAKAKRSDLDPGLFDFFEQVFTLQVTGPLESEFVFRFQQFTSPVMAKGVEDTAFYCFNRLTALCEVGGDPGRDGTSLDQFHVYQTKMQSTHPNTMTTLSTHDTKRSDDVRARLAVLSEVPHEFERTLHQLAQHGEGYKSEPLPDSNTEYFLYQTLIGAWPIGADRVKAYMQKAMREAKMQTSWVVNNKAYEDALNHFIDCLLVDEEFVGTLEGFVSRVLLPGRINSLAQSLLKNTAPGVPDLYQGAELWDLSLVDPDNRRPVDYALRTRLLTELQGLSAADILARMDEGLPKLHVIHQSLLLRRGHPEWFGAAAAYTALLATGRRARHVVAFLRGESVMTVVPRHTMSVENWDSTSLAIPAGTWTNRLTGETHEGGFVPVSKILEVFPVALLVRD